MPEQFVIPQFLDVETKIIGFITMRQFLILLVTLMTDFLIYRIFLNIIVVLLLGLPILAAGIIFAFAKVNGQPFHFVVLSMIQTLRKPMARVWDKSLTESQVRTQMKKEEEAPAQVAVHKVLPESKRLSELALIVNTGGVYNPQNQENYGK
ncbi:PrgI family protein [Patescibacteria group bacterium]|nr:PrgI family protein [Patescibacteria group bacterium]MBU4453214.1 PrgI family protein [Patescibacteria group bacterium]MCG2687733.1 PrgI family protein [Candidatus Parcubacteria bacterium]